MTVAGSDSGGGAGIQADLRAFTFFKVFGTSALTAVTAQNPQAVTDVAPLPPLSVEKQIAAILAAFKVGAVKTGMLFSAEIIRSVAESLRACRGVPRVVDPVMVATSGARLLRDDAVTALCDLLLPGATVITPNLPEAEVLLARSLRTAAESAPAVRELARRFGGLVVLKGGHTHDAAAVDLISDGTRLWQMASPRVAAATTHGTGCALSAATAACLALGHEPLAALRLAKAYVYASLQCCVRVGPAAWAMTEPAALPVEEIVLREL